MVVLVSETVPRRDAGSELTWTYLQRVSETNTTTPVRNKNPKPDQAPHPPQSPNRPLTLANSTSNSGGSQYSDPKRSRNSHTR